MARHVQLPAGILDGQLMVYDATTNSMIPLSVNTLLAAVRLTVAEEGTVVDAAVTQLNFVGADVTATEISPGHVEVSVVGGGGSVLTVQDEGTNIDTAVTQLNFVGAGVTATDPVSGEVTVTVPGGGSSAYVGCKLYRAAALTLTVGGASNSVIDWDSEDWDTDGFHEGVTHPDRITIPAGLGGRYEVGFALGVGTPIATNRFLAAVYKNGAATRGGNAEISSGSATYPCHALTFELDLAAGDFINAQYYIDSGSSGPAMHTVASCFWARKTG